MLAYFYKQFDIFTINHLSFFVFKKEGGNTMSYEKFGKDIKTLLNAVETARRMGATDQFWKKLADEKTTREVIEFLFPEHLVVSVDYDVDINIFDKRFELTNDSRRKIISIKGERKREKKLRCP